MRFHQLFSDVRSTVTCRNEKFRFREFHVRTGIGHHAIRTDQRIPLPRSPTIERDGAVGRKRSRTRRNLESGERPWMLVGSRTLPPGTRKSANSSSSATTKRGKRIRRIPSALRVLSANPLPPMRSRNEDHSRDIPPRLEQTMARLALLPTGSSAIFGTICSASGKRNSGDLNSRRSGRSDRLLRPA